MTARPAAGPVVRRRAATGAARRLPTTATLPVGGVAPRLTGWLGTLVAGPERGRVTTPPAPAARPRLRPPGGHHGPHRHRHPDGLLELRHAGLRRPAGRLDGHGRAAAPVGQPGHRGHGRHDAARLPLAAHGLAALLRGRHRPPRAGPGPGLRHRRRRLGPLAADPAAAGGPPGRARQAGPGRLPGPLDGQPRRAHQPHPRRHDPVPAARRADHLPGRSRSPTWARPRC